VKKSNKSKSKQETPPDSESKDNISSEELSDYYSSSDNEPIITIRKSKSKAAPKKAIAKPKKAAGKPKVISKKIQEPEYEPEYYQPELNYDEIMNQIVEQALLSIVDRLKVA
jgi:hypothetical protein